MTTKAASAAEDVQPPDVTTGIAGPDEALNGELLPNGLYLIEGRPGTDKTTLALQFALEGVARQLAVLPVEDHGDAARIMRRLLGAEGHDVTIAGDKATALNLIGQHSFDLLISDLGLPDARGLDLMREVRRRGLTLPGIALWGYGQEQDLQHSRAAGFVMHLVKPTNPDQLRAAIADLSGPAPRRH